MSTINFNKLEKIIKKSSTSQEEKEELDSIVQEIIHHRIMGCILDNIDEKHHDVLFSKIQSKNNKIDDEIISFLEKVSKKQISKELQKTIKEIQQEIIKEMK
jgi:hypothetical protein